MATPYLQRDELIVNSTTTHTSEDGSMSTSVAGPRPADTIAAVSEVVPGGQEIPLVVPTARAGAPAPGNSLTGARYLRADGSYTGDSVDWVAVATPALIAHLELPSRLRGALARGEAIGIGRPAIGTARIGLDVPADDQGTIVGGTTTIPFGGWFEGPRRSMALPRILVPAPTLERHGLGAGRSSQTLLVFPADLTSGRRHRLEVLAEDLSWAQSETGPDAGATTRSVYLSVPEKPPILTKAQIKGLALLAFLLLVLAIVAVGLSLAAQDSEEERQVLVAMGASPRTIGRVRALRAVALVVIAGVIAVPAGLLPAAAVVAAQDAFSQRYAPDRTSLLLVLVLVPVAAGLATWAGGRIRGWLRPARPDVFAFGD
jgi:hypothetical protein